MFQLWALHVVTKRQFFTFIHEIRHFTLMTELLTFTIYFACLCKPIWGNASVSRVSLVASPFGWAAECKEDVVVVLLEGGLILSFSDVTGTDGTVWSTC